MERVNLGGELEFRIVRVYHLLLAFLCSIFVSEIWSKTFWNDLWSLKTQDGYCECASLKPHLLFLLLCKFRADGVCSKGLFKMFECSRALLFLEFTWQCASRHISVQFLISPLTTWLCARGFTRHTNDWKTTAFRDFSNIWHRCIFFLLTFALLHLLSSDFTSSKSVFSTCDTLKLAKDNKLASQNQGVYTHISCTLARRCWNSWIRGTVFLNCFWVMEGEQDKHIKQNVYHSWLQAPISWLLVDAAFMLACDMHKICCEFRHRTWGFTNQWKTTKLVRHGLRVH